MVFQPDILVFSVPSAEEFVCVSFLPFTGTPSQRPQTTLNAIEGLQLAKRYRVEVPNKSASHAATFAHRIAAVSLYHIGVSHTSHAGHRGKYGTTSGSQIGSLRRRARGRHTRPADCRT